MAGFRGASPAGNVFHTPEMFEAFRVPGYRPSLWAAVDDHSGGLALLTPVQITVKRTDEPAYF